MPRILCGDFNEPRTETVQGFESWAGKNHWSRQDPKKWSDAVEKVFVGLVRFDLVDVFRYLHGERIVDLWSVVVHGRVRRRYDHLLASRALVPHRADYLHDLDGLNLSDHTPAVVEFAL